MLLNLRRQLWSCVAAFVAVLAVLAGPDVASTTLERAADDAAWVGCEIEPGRQILHADVGAAGGAEPLMVEEEPPERGESETAPPTPIALGTLNGPARRISWPAQRWSRVAVWADAPGVVCVGAAPPAPGGVGKGRWIAPEGQRGPPV